MASRKGSSESSNTGLVVALVFFVLATIGLGVSTYMGYSGKTEADKSAKTAQNDKSTAEKRVREEQAQKLALLIATGSEQPADRQTFNGLRTEFTSSIQTELSSLKGLKTWDLASQGDRPPETYAVAFDRVKADRDKAIAERKTAEAALETAKDEASKTIAQRDTSVKTTEDNLKKARENLVAETSRKAAGSDEGSATIKKLNQENAELKVKLQNQEADFNGKVKEMQMHMDTNKKVREEFAGRIGPIMEKLEQVKNQRPELHDLAELYDHLSRQFERTQSLVNDTPKGKLISVDRSSGEVYVNLGSADNVQPQITFSVLPAGSTGKTATSRERKGAIEIVSVQDAHLSKAKVIDLPNPIRDPFMSGDLLFNPVWSPSQQMHIAIAGIIDLNGDGIDDTPDLVKTLARQGVAVDAYLDLRSHSIVGPGMTEKTTYLVLGESPILSSNISPEGNPIGTATVEVLGKIDELRSKARDLGVERVQYRRFLSMIGYRLPPAMKQADYSQSSYLRDPNGALKKPGDGKDDKPK